MLNEPITIRSGNKHEILRCIRLGRGHQDFAFLIHGKEVRRTCLAAEEVFLAFLELYARQVLGSSKRSKECIVAGGSLKLFQSLVKGLGGAAHADSSSHGHRPKAAIEHIAKVGIARGGRIDDILSACDGVKAELFIYNIVSLVVELFFVEEANAIVLEVDHRGIASIKLRHLQALHPVGGQLGPRVVVGVGGQFLVEEAYLFATAGERHGLQGHKELLAIADTLGRNDENLAIASIHVASRHVCGHGIGAPNAFTLRAVGVLEDIELAASALVAAGEQHTAIGQFLNLRLVGGIGRLHARTAKHLPRAAEVVGIDDVAGKLVHVGRTHGVGNVEAVVVAHLHIATLHNLTRGQEDAGRCFATRQLAVVETIYHFCLQSTLVPCLAAVHGAEEDAVLRMIACGGEVAHLAGNALDEYLVTLAVGYDAGISECRAPFEGCVLVTLCKDHGVAPRATTVVAVLQDFVNLIEAISVVIAYVGLTDAIVANGKQSAVAQLGETWNAVGHLTCSIVEHRDRHAVHHCFALADEHAEVLGKVVAANREGRHLLSHARHGEVVAILHRRAVGSFQGSEGTRMVEAVGINDKTLVGGKVVGGAAGGIVETCAVAIGLGHHVVVGLSVGQRKRGGDGHGGGERCHVGACRPRLVGKRTKGRTNAQVGSHSFYEECRTDVLALCPEGQFLIAVVKHIARTLLGKIDARLAGYVARALHRPERLVLTLVKTLQR